MERLHRLECLHEQEIVWLLWNAVWPWVELSLALAHDIFASSREKQDILKHNQLVVFSQFLGMPVTNSSMTTVFIPVIIL